MLTLRLAWRNIFRQRRRSLLTGLSMTETETQYVVTLTPREQTVTVWDRIDYVVNKEPLLPAAQIFFDDQGERVRELTFSDPKEFDGKLMPSKLEMKPLNKPGHVTRILYDAIEFNPDNVSEETFTMRNLKSRF